MDSILFEVKDDLGAPLGSFTLIGTYVYGGNDYGEERYNQVSKITLDGEEITYDNGIERTESQIKAKSVSLADGYAFRTFIKTVMFYKRYKFDATPSHPLLDIGAGNGVKVENAKIMVKTLKGVFTKTPPVYWTVVLPFSFRSN